MTWGALAYARRAFTETDAPLDTETERVLMSKGWLVKVRFPDQPGANVTWFWIPIGNCTACSMYEPDMGVGRCTDPRPAIYLRYPEYMLTNTCPAFDAGQSLEKLTHDHRAWDMLDAMRAAGLAAGEPRQQVEVLEQYPWTPWRSHQARMQQKQFLAQARSWDAGHRDRLTGDVGPIEPRDPA